jgi:hypothetical protein
MPGLQMKSIAGRRLRVSRLVGAGLGFFSLVGGMVILSGTAPSGAAGNLYVSPYGSDTNPCTSSAPCLTLAHAYSVASAGNTINLAAGTFTGGLTITKSINIVGVDSGGSLNATTTTISHGTSLHQFILEINKGTVNISDVVVDGQDKLGGGVDVNAPGIATLTNVNVVNNIANQYGGAGVQNDGTLTMTGGSISGNTNQDLNGIGGGFFSADTAITSTFNGVSFTHNTATDEGGGLFLDAGAVIFKGNIAIHDNSAATDGGGIEKCAGTLTFAAGSTVSNTANTPNDFGTAC